MDQSSSFLPLVVLFCCTPVVAVFLLLLLIAAGLNLLAIVMGERRAQRGMDLPLKRSGFFGAVRAAQKQARFRQERAYRQEQQHWQVQQAQQLNQLSQQLAAAERLTRLNTARQAAESSLLNLTPEEFELYIGHLLAQRGLTVEHCGGSHDRGIDLIVTKGRKKGIVQCKRYAPAQKIGAPTVRDLRGVVVRERAQFGILVTTSSFTQEAQTEATHEPKIILWDYAKVSSLQ